MSRVSRLYLKASDISQVRPDRPGTQRESFRPLIGAADLCTHRTACRKAPAVEPPEMIAREKPRKTKTNS